MKIESYYYISEIKNLYISDSIKNWCLLCVYWNNWLNSSCDSQTNIKIYKRTKQPSIITVNKYLMNVEFMLKKNLQIINLEVTD